MKEKQFSFEHLNLKSVSELLLRLFANLELFYLFFCEEIFIKITETYTSESFLLNEYADQIKSPNKSETPPILDLNREDFENLKKLYRLHFKELINVFKDQITTIINSPEIQKMLTGVAFKFTFLA